MRNDTHAINGIVDWLHSMRSLWAEQIRAGEERLAKLQREHANEEYHIKQQNQFLKELDDLIALKADQ